LLSSSNVDNDLSIGADVGILAAIMVFVRLMALAALHLSYRKNWL
jgi:hypothetical protein